MSRDAQNQAKSTYNDAKDIGTTAGNNANNLYNQLVPTFANEASNPQGFGKTDLADMNTNAQQSIGGGVGAAVGKAATDSAANKNAGGFGADLDEASRQAGRQFSNVSTGIAGENAKLKEVQRQAGIAGESGLQGEQNSMVLPSLGVRNNSTSALTEAGKSGWFQNMIAMINALKPGQGGPQYSGGGGGGGDQSSVGSSGGDADYAGMWA